MADDRANGGWFAGFTDGFLHAVTFGHGPEIRSWWQSTIQHKGNYKDILKQERATHIALNTKHPIATFVGKLAGLATSVAATSWIGGPLFGVASKLPLLGRIIAASGFIGKFAAGIATIGGVDGLYRMSRGEPAGAAFGHGFGDVVNGVKSAFHTTSNLVSGTRTPEQPPFTPQPSSAPAATAAQPSADDGSAPAGGGTGATAALASALAPLGSSSAASMFATSDQGALDAATKAGDLTADQAKNATVATADGSTVPAGANRQVIGVIKATGPDAQEKAGLMLQWMQLSVAAGGNPRDVIGHIPQEMDVLKSQIAMMSPRQQGAPMPPAAPQSGAPGYNPAGPAAMPPAGPNSQLTADAAAAGNTAPYSPSPSSPPSAPPLSAPVPPPNGAVPAANPISFTGHLKPLVPGAKDDAEKFSKHLIKELKKHHEVAFSDQGTNFAIIERPDQPGIYELRDPNGVTLFNGDTRVAATSAISVVFNQGGLARYAQSGAQDMVYRDQFVQKCNDLPPDPIVPKNQPLVAKNPDYAQLNDHPGMASAAPNAGPAATVPAMKSTLGANG